MGYNRSKSIAAIGPVARPDSDGILGFMVKLYNFLPGLGWTVVETFWQKPCNHSFLQRPLVTISNGGRYEQLARA